MAIIGCRKSMFAIRAIRESIFAKTHFEQSESFRDQKPTSSNPIPPSSPSRPRICALTRNEENFGLLRTCDSFAHSQTLALVNPCTLLAIRHLSEVVQSYDFEDSQRQEYSSIQFAMYGPTHAHEKQFSFGHNFKAGPTTKTLEIAETLHFIAYRRKIFVAVDSHKISIIPWERPT